MRKSICIKSNNKIFIDFMLSKIRSLNFDQIYLSHLYFKKYENIIIHYKGNKYEEFFSHISSCITSGIVYSFENKLIKNMISCNYFYFSISDQRKIFNFCKDFISSKELPEVLIRFSSLSSSVYDYITNNKAINIDGFLNFRAKQYLKALDYIVDLSVNKFVIDKEYTDFIKLLKTYISSKPISSKIIHLIYTNKESILLDENKNLIDLSNDIDIKYLSDISFSSNDYALSTLLTILPAKIIIHITDKEDEFITTLKLIFDSRVYICNDCSLCRLYGSFKINSNK